MLGDEVLGSVRVVNHDARDESSLTWMGRFGADVPVWLNSLWAEADLRITTGFVEPHFFAGFSGGPKLVAPGLAGLETTLVLHDAARIGHADARWGVTHGNPVHDDVRAIAAGTGTTSRSTWYSTAPIASLVRSAASCSRCTRRHAWSCGRPRCGR